MPSLNGSRCALLALQWQEHDGSTETQLNAQIHIVLPMCRGTAQQSLQHSSHCVKGFAQQCNQLNQGSLVVLWQDDDALAAHKNFLAAMQQVNEDVDKRNKLDGKMRSVVGSHGLPYTFLRPTPTPDVGGGVPCSTCI